MHAASFLFGSSIYVHGGEGVTTATAAELSPGDYLPEGDENPTASYLQKHGFVEKTILSEHRPPSTCLDDCWCLDTQATPLRWVKVPSKLSPLPRKYHTCTIASVSGAQSAKRIAKRMRMRKTRISFAMLAMRARL